jgi:hypothetical protein
MTTNAMGCEDFSDRLMAYLEHETDETTRAALERHAVGCAECGPLLADVRKLRVDASNLPELVPSRDLWSGIAARIEAPVVSIGTARQPAGDRSVIVRRWTRRMLIAASLVGAAGVGYFAAGGRREVVVAVAPPQVVAQQQPETVYQVRSRMQDSAARAMESVPAGQTPTRNVSNTGVSIPANPGTQSAVAVMNADYDREIARLRTLIEQRRNQMDPVTVAIIEKNLQVIDGAIAECKKAIARDPASGFLIESLNQSLQTKVELMRTAALLPTRT